MNDNKSKYDVVAVGNALMDVLVNVGEEEFEMLSREFSMKRGSMSLIDEVVAEKLYDRIGQAIESSGGSAANTISGLASMGARVAHIGKTANDQLGEIFRHDMIAQGVHFDVKPLKNALTGRCIVLVTPDAERTMNTFLGASTKIFSEDISEELISSSYITYLEGYLYDEPEAKKAFARASEYAHKAGKKVALTLSDPFCVERHRSDFLQLLQGHIDIVFANEEEVNTLYKEDDIDKSIKNISKNCEIAVITGGAKGAVIATKDERISIPAKAVDKVVDTTGAGDQFAAGFLYGLTRNLSLRKSGEIASITASEVISHMGARLEFPKIEHLIK